MTQKLRSVNIIHSTVNNIIYIIFCILHFKMNIWYETKWKRIWFSFELLNTLYRPIFSTCDISKHFIIMLFLYKWLISMFLLVNDNLERKQDFFERCFIEILNIVFLKGLKWLSNNIYNFLSPPWTEIFQVRILLKMKHRYWVIVLETDLLRNRRILWL